MYLIQHSHPMFIKDRIVLWLRWFLYRIWASMASATIISRVKNSPTLSSDEFERNHGNAMLTHLTLLRKALGANAPALRFTKVITVTSSVITYSMFVFIGRVNFPDCPVIIEHLRCSQSFALDTRSACVEWMPSTLLPKQRLSQTLFW